MAASSKKIACVHTHYKAVDTVNEERYERLRYGSPLSASVTSQLSKDVTETRSVWFH